LKILIATEVIHPGGAETFILRLSQALHEKGHDVTIYNFHGDIFHRELRNRTAPDVPVVCAPYPCASFGRLVDALLRKAGIDRSLRNYFIKKRLRRFLAKKKPDVIHSHLFKTDVLCCKVAAGNTPVVSTQHGDYTMYYNLQASGKKISILNFQKKLVFVLKELRHIVCISKEQEDFFEDVIPALGIQPAAVSKIYNGYATALPSATSVTRARMGIPTDAFVFGMVARGIPSKGWEELVAAFLKLGKPNTFLLLVGGSDYVDALREKYKEHPQIIFSGTVTNPIDWIRLFDVGILPSYFGSESLPTVIMEYLFCGKPVIATRIGEVPRMISHQQQTAGLLVEIVNGTTDVDQLHNCMLQLSTDNDLYNSLKTATAKCFEQFDMNSCVAKYEEIYRQCSA